MKHRYIAAALFLICAHAGIAQVAAGGGGDPRPDQFFTVQPPFDQPRFSAGAVLTTVERQKRDDQWRAEIRRQLFIPARLPPLHAEVHSTFSPMPGVLADRVSFDTADGMIVPAIVYRPDPAVSHWKGKLPGIVVVNGTAAISSAGTPFTVACSSQRQARSSSPMTPSEKASATHIEQAVRTPPSTTRRSTHRTGDSGLQA